MIITPIKTHPITANSDTMNDLIDRYVPNIKEGSILAVTSKIVSLCEGRVADASIAVRDDLVESEADYYLPRETNKYGFCITVKNDTLIASAGIDESNGNGNFVLWPKDPQQSVNAIREYLVTSRGLQDIGVLMTDSHVVPLRWGTMGTCMACSGFSHLHVYVGTPDIFGRKLKVTKSNIAEGLAAASVVTMGEGNEQTPMALLSDLSLVEFTGRNPTEEELKSLYISLQDDVFASLLTSAPWVKGKKV
jgi:dihydrofolate synthase / folylpolyglutamate synthase